MIEERGRVGKEGREGGRGGGGEGEQLLGDGVGEVSLG